MVLSRQLDLFVHFRFFSLNHYVIHPIKTQQGSADGKASLCLNPHPGLMDTELLQLCYGLWTQRDIYGVQFLTSSI